VTLK